MTKTRVYKYYGYTFKTYCKPVGHGYEVGCLFEGKPLFVGNFVHRPEMNQWWSFFNTEVKKFFNRHEFPFKGPTQWMTKFFTNHMYSCYYAWLDKKFTKYTREYTTACKMNEKQYRKMQPNWKKHGYLKHAA
ncbi:MAG: hypothetical protein AB7O96_14745 [Pseudobdellovibrionaceae bacterium]